LTQEFLPAYRDDYNAHGYLGYIYLQMGDLARAEEEYSRSYQLWLSEDTQKHLEAARKQKQSEASSRNKPNQSLEPTAGCSEVHI
jgi:Tfp pilus assembly protein PilF